MKLVLVNLNMDEAAESSEASPGGPFYFSHSFELVARLRKKPLVDGKHIGLVSTSGAALAVTRLPGMTFN